MQPSKNTRKSSAGLIDRWFIVAVVIGIPVTIWWWRGHQPAPLAVLASEVLHGMLWVALAAGVAVALPALLGRFRVPMAERRAQVARRISGAVLAVIGSDAPAKATVLRWSKGSPLEVEIVLPRTWDREKTGADRKLRTALQRATGVRWSEGVYVEDPISLTVGARSTFCLAPDQTPEEMQREEAESRADELLRRSITSAKSVQVLTWDGVHPSRIKVAYRPTPGLAFASKQALVEDIVKASFPGRWRAQWETERDEVVFELRPGLPDKVYRPLGLGKPAKPALRYAVDADGETIAWQLTGTGPHALVVGPTGGGKTYLLRAMAMDAIAQGIEVFGCDPKRIELMGLRGLPGVGRIATSPEDMAELIIEMHGRMEETYRLIETRKIRPDQIERVMFIVDEFFILIMRLNRLWHEEKNKGEHPVIALVWEMLALARSAGIHLAIGIQRPDAAFVDGPARDNLRHRASLTSLSPDGAKMMWGDVHIGTDLPAVPGRATATGTDGRPVEAQVWMVPDPDPASAGEWSAQDRAILAEVFGADWVEEQVRWARDPIAALPAGDGAKVSHPGVIAGEVIRREDCPSAGEEEFEEILEEAVEIVTGMGYASAPMLVRKLRVRYEVATRLIAELEVGGIIGPERDGGGHEVLITPARIEALIEDADKSASGRSAAAEPVAEPAQDESGARPAPIRKAASSKPRSSKGKESGAGVGGCAGEVGSAQGPTLRPCQVCDVQEGDVVVIDGRTLTVVGSGEDPDDDELYLLEVRPLEGGGVEVMSMDAYGTVMQHGT